MRSSMKGAVCILASLAVLVCAASASQIVRLTPRQMADYSELVVSGRVDGVTSFWNGDRTKIFTRIDVLVDEAYKGEKRARIELLQLGGTVGNVKVTVEGALAWRSGEEVLLFLEPYPGGRYQVAGLSQGRFEIERDEQTGKRYVRRPALGGTAPMQADGSPAGRPADVERIALEQFVSEALAKE
ncbi:MAG: hypothetical protein PHQ19_08645 [Candidatus Krumholzibacteria bacterium]|nr:hypothetical protein [Candidatus Krumholzibacteria bacterium]